MSRSKQSPRQRSRHPLALGCVSAVAIAFCMWAVGEVTFAHEHKHTHQNLTRAAFRLLGLPYERIGGLTLQEIENELAQGVIDEDECIGLDDFGRDWDLFPNWNSHFYEAKLRVRLSGPIAGDGPGKVCDDGPEIQGTHSSAADRARSLYQVARDDYAAGNYKSAFRVLGRVLHLLEDMTSPAHVHDDPHAEIGKVCEGDADDFERYGYCEGLASSEKNRRICEYFHDASTAGYPGPTQMPATEFDPGCQTPPMEVCQADFDSDGTQESYGVPPRGFTCRLWSALHILYDGKPQVSWPNPVGENAGYAFVHKLANVTYDFTTFTVHLQDVSPFDDPLPEPSELASMLRGSTVEHCSSEDELGLCEATVANSWRISGGLQQIGRTEAREGRVEATLPDAREEWWLMPTGYSKTFQGVFNQDVFIDGFAYIENAGGEGPNGEVLLQDTFVPLRYGCAAGEAADNSRLCSTPGPERAKPMYRQLYGTVTNSEDPFIPVERRGKTLLRIYGDVLYTSAVAYGAGLIKRFVDQVTVPPVAVPGGPYSGEACTPVTFDASGSSDANGQITAYAWDFTDDGTFDVSAPAAVYPYAYSSPFNGKARLRVTDNEGFFTEATTDVVITPDVTAPVITNATATPTSLWPVNHQMREVAISVSVADACGGTTCHVVGVTSSETGKGRGPKSGEPDWIVSGPLTIQFRAERSGAIGHRVYTVTLSCEDGSGNASTGTVTVTVPHDRGHR